MYHQLNWRGSKTSSKIISSHLINLDEVLRKFSSAFDEVRIKFSSILDEAWSISSKKVLKSSSVLDDLFIRTSSWEWKGFVHRSSFCAHPVDSHLMKWPSTDRTQNEDWLRTRRIGGRFFFALFSRVDKAQDSNLVIYPEKSARKPFYQGQKNSWATINLWINTTSELPQLSHA